MKRSKNGSTTAEHSTNQEAIERKTQSSITSQLHLDGIADDLQRACDEVIDIKIAEADLKLRKEQAFDKVLIEMKKSDRDFLKLTHAGDVWEFRVIPSEEAVRCAKASKNMADDPDQGEL